MILATPENKVSYYRQSKKLIKVSPDGSEVKI
jgi:hypothetical protein